MSVANAQTLTFACLCREPKYFKADTMDPTACLILKYYRATGTAVIRLPHLRKSKLTSLPPKVTYQLMLLWMDHKNVCFNSWRRRPRILRFFVFLPVRRGACAWATQREPTCMIHLIYWCVLASFVTVSNSFDLIVICGILLACEV